jgi:serine/threonine protein kinase
LPTFPKQLVEGNTSGKEADQFSVVTRFFNEARAANRIPHPAIIQVSEFGRTPSGAAFLVMEFLDGAVLSDYLQSVGGTLTSDQTIAIATQIADALSAAHARGVTHRDLKPGNIMLVADPLLPEGVRLKILDLGLAKLESASNTARHTRSGAIMGTDQAFSFCRRDRLSGSARYLCWQKVELAGCCMIACGLCDSGAYGIT